MKLQFNNKVISSFKLAVDHEILEKGEGFSNASGRFYSVTGNLYGLNAYSTPYRQLVHDVSIQGATQVSGLFIGTTFIQPGTSGLVSYNIEEGLAYFSNKPSVVSGSFAVKECNVYLTFAPEEELLFEQKLWLKPLYPQTLTGLTPNQQTYPVVFIKPINIENDPACLGGVENKVIRLRAVVLAKDHYQLTAICNILEDMAHNRMPILDVTGLPFDALGGYTGVSYNYTGLINGVTNTSYINSAKTSMLMNAQQYNQTNPAVFPAFVDFELWNFITP